jgi:hypothetical protein
MNAPFTEPRVTRLNFSRTKTESAGPPNRARWPLKRWLLFIALIFAAHLAAIFIFAERKLPAPRPVMNVPHLQLADNSSEILALDNPTLFALPRAGDLASVGLQTPTVNPPVFRWSESPHFLPLPAQMLGAVFRQFMQTNTAQHAPLDFKPPPKLSSPSVSLPPVFADHSSWQLEGELAGRKLSGEITLPDWPYADVIAPSRVQVVVNESGNVVSAVLLPLNSPKNEIRDADADAYALRTARGLQFFPGPRLTIGNILFIWRTVPPPPTNSVTTP